MADTDLGRAVAQLVGQVGHWEQSRWSVGTPGATRGDRVHALAQRLADAAADAEGRPRRSVPRLADPVLPDQIRVLAADLAAADPPAEALAAAVTDVRTTRRAL